MQDFNIIIDRGDNAKKILIHHKSKNIPTDKEINEIVYNHTNVPIHLQSIEQKHNFFFVTCPDHDESICCTIL